MPTSSGAPDAELIGFLGDYEDAADGLDPIGLSEQMTDDDKPAARRKEEGRARTMSSVRFHSIAARVLLIAALALGSASAFAQTGAQVPWSSLTADQQQLLEAVHKNWDQLPPPAQQRLIRGAQRWSTLTPEQRDNVRKRFEKWNSLQPDQREKLRDSYENFKHLPPEQQQRIRQAFKRFGALPAEQRQKLRERFNQMSPAERKAFLLGAESQNRAGIIHEFMQSIPQEERLETRQAFAPLNMEQRRTFIRTWRALPQDQREAYRKRIVQMSPEDRAAELSKPPPNP